MAFDLPKKAPKPKKRPDQKKPPVPTPRPGTSPAVGYGQMAETMAQAGVPHIGLSPDMIASMGPQGLGGKIPPITPQDLIPPITQQNTQGGMTPPITPQDLIPPITPGNTQGALTPPITPENTNLASMISPITSQNTAPNLGSRVPPITPGNTAAPNLGAMIPPITPAAPQPGVDPRQTGSVDPRRAILAQMMARQSPRAESAGYTTSGTGWPGASSAIFGRNR